MNRPISHVACPSCGKDVPWEPQQKWRPFCSERCKLIDLGTWFDESNRIPGDTASAAGQEQES